MLHNYHPEDIFDGVNPDYLIVTPFVVELDWWNYNTEVYSELPISSWWDITKPEWNGKFVFLDPSGEPDLPVLLAAMVQRSDLLEADYEKVFGKPIELADQRAGMQPTPGSTGWPRTARSWRPATPTS